ncbi:MAG: hypothetical protein LBS59_06945 [Puniceicoccales bacterium]|nr:hypothetical protein [Puniceicoccales bacterium]
MKKFSFLVPLTCAALALSPLAVTAAEGDAPPPPKSERGPRGGPRAGAAQRAPQVKLTPEETTKLRAALSKLRGDKDIAEARKGIQKAQSDLQKAQAKLDSVTKAAVVKIDPSLDEVVKKFGNRPLRPFGGRGGDRPAGQRPEGFRRRGGRDGAPPPQPPSADNL